MWSWAQAATPSSSCPKAARAGRAPSAETRSELPGNLRILNSGAGDSNTIQDVKIDGSLLVAKDGTDGRNDLKIIDSIVGLSTSVLNNNGGSNGDSNTTIQGSQLRGSLAITNGTGADLIDMEGSTVGSSGGGATTITNGDGGSRDVFTTYAGIPTASGQNTTTLYGSLSIQSGAGYIGVGIADTVVFTGTEVKGPVSISSASGDSKTVMGNPLPGSNLGSDVVAGGPVTVTHGQGFDSFDMETSSAKWGLSITNGVAGQTNGSVTKIVNSQVSTYPPPVLTSGLTVNGDDGADLVTITDSQIGGATVLNLGNGDNQVTLQSTALPNTTRNTLTSLSITTGTGNDSVSIQKTDITVSTLISLGAGQDTVNIDYQATATPAVPLSHLLGPVTINGGPPAAPETDLLEYASAVQFGSINFVNISVIVSP